jgi:hypothetical protein
MFTYVIKVKYPNSEKYYIGTCSKAPKNIYSDFKFILKFSFFSSENNFSQEFDFYDFKDNQNIELVRFSDESFQQVLELYKSKIDTQYLRWENYDDNFPKINNYDKKWSEEDNKEFIQNYKKLSMKDLMNKFARTEAGITAHVNTLKNKNPELVESLSKRVINLQAENSNTNWKTSDNNKLISLYKENTNFDDIAKQLKRTQNAVIHHLAVLSDKNSIETYNYRKWSSDEIDEIKQMYSSLYEQTLKDNIKNEDDDEYEDVDSNCINVFKIKDKTITSLISEKFHINEFSIIKFLIRLHLYKIM